MNIKQLIEKLKAKNCLVFMTITGGGTRAISMLLEQGGASDIFVGAEVPYGYCIGNTPEHYVSARYAGHLAAHSYGIIQGTNLIRFIENKDFKLNCYYVALGCTAALYKEGQREDRKNHAWIAIHSNFKRESVYVDVTACKSRIVQEDELSEYILRSLERFVDSL